MRQLSIDQFENEGRRVSMGTNSVEKPQRTPLFERHNSDPGVHKAFTQFLSYRHAALLVNCDLPFCRLLHLLFQ